MENFGHVPLQGRKWDTHRFRGANGTPTDSTRGGCPVFRRSLAEAVTRWLEANPKFLDRPLVPRTATALRERPALSVGYPPSVGDPTLARDMAVVAPIARKIDFSGRDARNRELGSAGEELVFEHEKRVLTDAGRSDLAEQVKWISQEEGDGAGYDIASFSREGRDRLIEVKTTNGWDRTPFYISPNELKVADQRRDEWHLLRVWNYAREPKAFELRPPLDRHVSLAATGYLASFR